MNNETKTRATGVAAVIAGVMLIGTTGLTFALGWALWAVGLAVLLAAVPTGRDPRYAARSAPATSVSAQRA